MSVISKKSDFFKQLPKECAFCAKDVELPFIYWLGTDGADIVIHPECVVQWHTRLMRDYCEIKYATHNIETTLASASHGTN